MRQLVEQLGQAGGVAAEARAMHGREQGRVITAVVVVVVVVSKEKAHDLSVHASVKLNMIAIGL